MKETLAHGWNALLTAVLAAMFSALVLLAIPPEYRATATVLGTSDDQLVVQSGDLLEQVLNQTRVQADHLQGWLPRWLGRRQDTMSLLRERLTIAYDQTNDWISISVSSLDPGVAAILADHIAEAFVDRKAELSVSPATRLKLAGELAAVEAELDAFVMKHPALENLKQERSLLANRRAVLQQEQRVVNQQLAALQEKSMRIDQGELEAVPGEPVLGRSVVLRDKLALELSELSTRYGNRHVRYSAAAAKLDEAERQLGVALQAVRERIRVMESGNEKSLEGIRRDLNQLDEAEGRLLKLEEELRTLQRDREIAKRHYEIGQLPHEQPWYSASAEPVRRPGEYMLGTVAATFLFVFVLVLALSSRTRR